MVEHQIRARGVSDARVLRAMGKVPRHRFVPEAQRASAYADHPLPIGHEQTISQPFIVAFMTEALGLSSDHRVLEIGTGSGYQAAVLAELAREVMTIEIVEPLARQARDVLSALGYCNIRFKVGDGYQGWPQLAPFDAIILTAAPETIPKPLLAQLRKPGGVLVAPVGLQGEQELVRMVRTETGFSREVLLDVRFVPMTGRALRQSP